MDRLAHGAGNNVSANQKATLLPSYNNVQEHRSSQHAVVRDPRSGALHTALLVMKTDEDVEAFLRGPNIKMISKRLPAGETVKKIEDYAVFTCVKCDGVVTIRVKNMSRMRSTLLRDHLAQCPGLGKEERKPFGRVARRGKKQRMGVVTDDPTPPPPARATAFIESFSYGT